MRKILALLGFSAVIALTGCAKSKIITENNLFIRPIHGQTIEYKAETCIVDSEISEVEYFMYDDDENFSKVLVKDGTAYVFDKNGQIVNVFSGFILKYSNQKG